MAENLAAEKVVVIKKEQGVGWLYMNRPKALNSLTAELSEAIVEAVAELDADPEVRVIVFSGEGRAFCAGGDLGSLKALDNQAAASAFVTMAGKTSEALAGCGKPVIAMVNGVAAGAGFNLALACDIVFAAAGVKFIQSFTNIGLAPDCGGHYFLPRAIGSWRAKQAMFEAAPITAEQGKELGFVNEIYAPEELAEATAKYAAMLAKRAPLALAACKRLVNASGLMDLSGLLAAEAEAQSRLVVSADCKEGLAAFAEKRQPEFKGE